MRPLRVCVIGAGAAGLCAARHLSAAPKLFEPTVFELSDTIGGTWVYVPNTGLDRHGNPIHSSMYECMKTNLPKEVMAFPDFPFRPELESFLHHTRVKEYLEEYSDHFSLGSFIHLSTKVELVEPLDQGQWRVTSRALGGSSSPESAVFDAVMVCNGHYSVPHIPDLPGMKEHFRGLTMHSHDYRRPDYSLFGDKVVAILGAAASGTDISLEVSQVAKRVFLCHNNPPMQSEVPVNFHQARGIESCVGKDTLHLNDGSELTGVDVLLFCTGYEFTFPFLSPRCNVRVNCNRQISPLFKHLLHCERPTMAFVGLPIKICPFPLFDVQVRWFLRVLSGHLKLPSEQEMELDTVREKEALRRKGVADRHFHVFGTRQWKYNADLAEMADLTPIPENVQRLYDSVHERRVRNVMTYKNERYKQGRDGVFQLVHDEDETF